MTQQMNHLGRGGSTSVKSDGSVEHTGGGLNPGDRGYDEAVRKEPVESSSVPGTLNRRPGYLDRLEPQKAPAVPKPSRSIEDLSAPDPFFKPSKGDK